MAITAADVKKLRDMTGIGMMKCKEALTEADGDVEKAIELLRKRAEGDISKRASRDAKEGVIGCYTHFDNKLSVMVELNCETDFVAKTDDFQALAKDLAMHVAASNPLYLSPDSVPEDVVAKEKEIYREQAADKPERAIEKIVEGKLNKFFATTCLTEQPFVKDQDKLICDLVKEASARTGEKIEIRRFTRFRVGE
ncbi:translation elongation factor Ts [bacterium]|nr:translation elongation factor Ts [candidate division CSSED10-310 bacterium]